MKDDICIKLIETAIKRLEKTLDYTGFSLVIGGEETLHDDLFYVYDGDRFVGAFYSTILTERNLI